MLSESPPLTTCIMPTADRPEFVPAAVNCFLGQDYVARELIVLDNGATPVEHLIPADPRIRYMRAEPGGKLGALRNIACDAAKGEIIAHWDDDDWYPSDRISRQVACLTTSGADACGTSQLHFIDRDNHRAWLYRSQGTRPWFGSTLAYRRTVWQRRPFDAVQVGEDTRFIMALRRSQVVDLADPGLCVAAMHVRNTSPKRPLGSEWRAVAMDEVLGLKCEATPEPVPDVAIPQVCIGIHVRSEVGRLDATLRHLVAHTPASVQYCLLVDGSDPSLHASQSRYTHLPISATDTPKGAPACFNRLLREADADIYVFLESGSLVGPGWLTHLLAALAAGDNHGLTGPTTNMAWSVQGDLRNHGARPDNVDEIAYRLAREKAGQWQNLAPLYCLADFCYAVRREVVQRIGGADEAYGHGPCWEMDYTVRAARAGFAAVWARAAYVYRMPFFPQRQNDESRLMPSSKEQYQRKFCGKMLDGTRDYVVDHCRGDDCQHFAPEQKIRLYEPLAELITRSRTYKFGSAFACRASDLPVVSCIMPTSGRMPWVLQSIRYLQRQDYPNLELIIIDDGPIDMADRLPDDSRIRYAHRPSPESIGAKRNLACDMAAGDFIAHWDDDDWYGKSRLSAQLAPLLSGNADITAFDTTPFFDVSNWQFWLCTPALYARMFRYAVHGGTLVYKRTLFGPECRFPDTSLAEDADFLQATIRCGARLLPVASAEHFIYVRHGRNAWRFACGSYVDARSWRRIEPPSFLESDLHFYHPRRLAVQLENQ